MADSTARAPGAPGTRLSRRRHLLLAAAPVVPLLLPYCRCCTALQDHLNDIMSNTCAIITAVAAGHVPNGWWIDPAGAIAISLYIVARWLAIAKQQVCGVWQHVIEHHHGV